MSRENNSLQYISFNNIQQCKLHSIWKSTNQYVQHWITALENNQKENFARLKVDTLIKPINSIISITNPQTNQIKRRIIGFLYRG